VVREYVNIADDDIEMAKVVAMGRELLRLVQKGYWMVDGMMTLWLDGV